MGWEDPSPRPRGRAAVATSASPGYGATDVRLSFTTIAWRAVVALVAGVMIYAAAHAGMVALHGRQAAARHATLDAAVALVVAVVVGWLILRMLLQRPESAGLPLRVREGRGWFGRRRGWDDSYGNMSFGEAVAAEAVGDVIGAVIDAAID
jgi:preprotein translocase subunit SecG